MKGVGRVLASKDGCSRGSTITNESRSGEDVFCLQKDYRANRSGLLIKQTEFSCLPDGLYAVVDAQFGEDMADMAFDGIDDNHQLLSNLLVGCAACEQLEDLQFSLTQGIEQRLHLRTLSRSLGLRFLCLALLGKGVEQLVEIGGWSSFALLFP